MGMRCLMVFQSTCKPSFSVFKMRQLGSLLGQRSKSTLHQYSWACTSFLSSSASSINYCCWHTVSFMAMDHHTWLNCWSLMNRHVSSGQQIQISWLCLAARTALMVTGLSRVLFHVYGMLCLTQCVKSLQNTLLKNVWRRCFLRKPTTCSSIGFLCSTVSTF